MARLFFPIFLQTIVRTIIIYIAIKTQSMVRSDWRRTMLFELEQTIQKLRARNGDCEDVVGLTAHYHHLLREGAEL